MKLESLVIANQNVAVNTFPGLSLIHILEIARIAVIDEMKRQGVGHALMLALKAWSKEHQIAKVLLDAAFRSWQEMICRASAFSALHKP